MRKSPLTRVSRPGPTVAIASVVMVLTVICGHFGAPYSEAQTTPSSVQVAAGLDHTCALRAGRVSCWGAGALGELGVGRGWALGRPAIVPGVTGATRIASGFFLTCAVRRTGRLTCWGAQPVAGRALSTRDYVWPAPKDVPGLDGVTWVSGGFRQACAVANSKVYCWGNQGVANTLGDGRTHKSSKPIEAKDVQDAVSVEAAAYDACIVHVSGEISCWGLTIATAVRAYAKSPVTIPGITDAASVAIHPRGEAACVLRRTGEVSCWGYAASGLLGRQGASTTWTPTAVPGISDARSLAMSSKAVCVVHQNGSVSCWGSGKRPRVPTLVPGITNAVDISVAESQGGRPGHVCATTSAGGISCWGSGVCGQLGDGKWADAARPVRVSPPARIRSGARPPATALRHCTASPQY